MPLPCRQQLRPGPNRQRLRQLGSTKKRKKGYAPSTRPLVKGSNLCFLFVKHKYTNSFRVPCSLLIISYSGSAPHRPRRPRHATSPPPGGDQSAIAPMPLPTMTHSSSFLLPSPPAEAAAAADAVAYAVIVLNQRLPRFASLLWTRAQLRVCADGGANRLFDGMPELHPGEDPDEVRARYKPDAIKGDMDSIRPEVKEFYSNLGAKIVDESHDQDTTDLHKCISFITRNPPGPDKANLCILVLGALGGRFDHEMGNINVLYRFSNIKIILLSDESLIFLLPKTHNHEILVDQSIEGPHCGLIPMGMPSSSSTTTGLRWNLDNTSMSYGGLVSTSNIVDDKKVMVTSDSDLIWTISLRNHT
ncbi:thiamine pyrophosphokinase 1 [Brachypodium distachyon]|uniref:thiamine diphosphokinase n=1 Tax=Brachypodium distachyon TaxID=15368 RepID=A0A2K2DGW9_BRADI|nr:thiamine pyrophosphokinase 1 [Brachypodium distachyon]PNT73522.1 hypothetical protein BRADI_2g59740v3 [Brachypodium distachyon]|eukprot:XP_003565008.2 thiamine pyrophosphokinase 1 [Brachypodium distachyon]